MTAATFIHDGQVMDYTPSESLAFGDVVYADGIIGVSLRDTAAGSLGLLALDGVFAVTKKPDDEFEVGQIVYWDTVNSYATRTEGEAPVLGRASKAAAATDETVEVWLCASEPEEDPSGSIEMVGAAGVTTITPRWDFTKGTVTYSIEGGEPVALTSGVEANIALSEGQTIIFVASQWDSVTRIDFAADKVAADLTDLNLPATLQYLIINSTSFTGSVAGWTLPSTLLTLAINNTSLSGSVAGWVLPSTLTYLTAHYTSISGSVAGWTLPAGLTTLYLNNTSISGSVGGWTLPAAMQKLYLQNTSIEGDLTAWVIPSGMIELNLTTSNVEGDITDWVLPNTITTFTINGTNLTGDVGQWANIPPAAVTFNLSSSEVYGDINHWTLPSTLIYISVSGTGVEVDVSDWVIPSAMTIMSISAPGVEGDISGFVLGTAQWYFTSYNNGTYGDISGWTLPSVLKTLYVHGTGVDYDSSSGAFTGLTSALEKIDLDDCALTQAQVDNVLADCVASGVTGGKVLDLAGTNAAPSAGGLANKATLVSRGWTVNTN